MKFPQHRISAAAQAVHNNYSDVDVFEAEIGELVWAEGTVRAVIDQLGDSDDLIELRGRNAELRRLNLEAGESLNRIWSRVVGSEQPESSITVGIADRIIAKLDETPSEGVEITDAMVEAFIASAFAPSVVVSRDSVRIGLANALQTR